MGIVPALAQDDAPSIVSIAPGEATITGGGSVEVTVTYEDADGDANRFDWEIIEASAGAWNVPDGVFDQTVAGESIVVRFGCGDVDGAASLQLIVRDAAGNASEPDFFNLTCISQVTTSGQGGGGGETDSAPTVVGFEPASVTLGRDSEIVVNLTVADPDLDARRLYWAMQETDAIKWDLPMGYVYQSTAETTVPVTFFCSTPGFTAAIALVVEDLNGNQSEPAIFQLACR
ncbi:MAG: hypothetical protein IH587_13460 [Anaerolineae bacterium]|nr:hypothetical protein [Anaerolineae bacterium]